VLPKKARLTTSEDFAKATKSGLRLTSENLVGYLYISPVANNVNKVNNEQPAKCGLIINKSVGGSVMRHRIARQLRHDLAPNLDTFPTNSLFVVRVLKSAPEYTNELTQLITGLLSRSQKNVSR
jgi:ribonuclease P protein component